MSEKLSKEEQEKKAEEWRGIYRRSLYALADDCLGLRDWDQVHHDVEALLRKPSRRKAILLPRGHLKCVNKNARVLTSSGQYKPASEIKPGDQVLSLSPDLKTRWNKVVAVESNGVRAVKKLKLRSGKEVSATGNHPFYEFDAGWTPLDALPLGARVAVPRELPVGSVSNVPLARFLAFMLGDGSCTRCMFTKQDPLVRQLFMKAVHDLGGHARDLRPKDKVPYCDFRGLRPLMREHGIMGKRAAEKFIPPVVFMFDRETLAEFLRSLYTCDGSGRTHEKMSVSYSSTSHRLSLDLQSLLLRFGILSTVYRINTLYKGEPYVSYQTVITTRESRGRFVEEIGFHGRKAADAGLGGTGKLAATVDTVPPTWRKYLGPSEPYHLRLAGIRIDNEYATTRDKVLRSGVCLDSEPLKILGNSDVFWDEVIAIDDDGECETFDIEVERDHNFVVDDVFSHNTSLVTITKSIQLILQNPNVRILIAHGVWDLSRKMLSEIKQHLQNPKLKYLFGDFVSNKWNEDEIIVKQRTKALAAPTISTTGIEAETTGSHYDAIFLDDLMGLQNVQTPEQREKAKRFRRSMINLLDPGGLLVEIGTRWSLDDTFSDILSEKERKYYDVMVRQVVEDGKVIFPLKFAPRFDANRKIWFNEYDVFLPGPDGKPKSVEKIAAPMEHGRGKIEEIVKKKHGPGATFKCINPPTRMDYIEYLKNSMPISEFLAQYMNNPIDDEHALFKKAMFRYWTQRPDGLYVGMSVDLAISEKAGADYTAFVVGGMDAKGDIYILDYLQGKWAASDIVRNLFDMHRKWNPHSTGMETNGFQRTIKYAAEDEMRRQKYHFPIHEIKTGPQVTKEYRIKALEPFYRSGKAHHARWMEGKDLETQLQTFPVSKHDDLMDAEAMLLNLLMPGRDAPPPRVEEGTWEYHMRQAARRFQRPFLGYTANG